jgi:hypothetical protein
MLTLAITPAVVPKPNRANDRLQARLAKAIASRTSQSSPRSSIDTARGSVDKERPASTEPFVSRQSTDTPEPKPTEHESPVAEPTPVVEPPSTPAESQPTNSKDTQDTNQGGQDVKQETTTPTIIEPHSDTESQTAPAQQATDKTETQPQSLDHKPDLPQATEPERGDAPARADVRE